MCSTTRFVTLTVEAVVLQAVTSRTSPTQTCVPLLCSYVTFLCIKSCSILQACSTCWQEVALLPSYAPVAACPSLCQIWVDTYRRSLNQHIHMAARAEPHPHHPRRPSDAVLEGPAVGWPGLSDLEGPGPAGVLPASTYAADAAQKSPSLHLACWSISMHRLALRRFWHCCSPTLRV